MRNKTAVKLTDEKSTEKKVETPSNKKEKATGLKADVRAQKTAELREKASTLSDSLGSLKMSADQPKSSSEHISEHIQDQDEEPVLLLTPSNENIALTKPSKSSSILNMISAALTALWLGFCLAALFTMPALEPTPQSVGAFLAGMLAPPALLWLIVATLNRQADVSLYASSLRAELQSLLFPSEETASVINQDVERLCRQAAEIAGASKATLKTLQRARQG